LLRVYESSPPPAVAQLRLISRMTPALKGFLLIDPILLVAFVVLAILVYRAKRTTAFLLLMLASICYFLPRFAPFAIGFVEGRSTKAAASIHAWFHSWWSFGVNQAFDLLFLGLIVAALVFFIREQRRTATPAPNPSMQLKRPRFR
jgi:hypothetical protein